MYNNASTQAKQRSGALYAIGAILLLAAGFALGMMFMGTRYPVIKEPLFKQFNASYTHILNDYLNGATPEQLIQGAATGMVEALEDPYSHYLAGDKGEEYTQSYEGQFYGIGAEMKQEDGKVMISVIIKDTPAERAGLQPGDVIIAVDGKDVTGKTLQDLLGIVRGDEGTTIKIRVHRAAEQEPLEFTMKRAAIPVHTVTSERLEGGIGLITISRFAEETAKEFKAELEKLKADGELKGLLLDLRSNPGGLLQPTTEIASILIPKDKKILDIVYKNERRIVSLKSKQQEEWKAPIVVLVNGRSASASEVLASALKESAGAVLVGEKTYGKGVVQGFKQFKDGSVISLTEAQWKTPGGTWINKQGVAPDHVVALPEYASLRQLALGTVLKRGSYGDEVKSLQGMLGALGYAPVGQDGLFDAEAEAALRKFQGDHGLDVTGKFGDATSYKLIELLRAKLKQEDTQVKKGIELLKQQ
ncbi:S41 family peptidase [Paenibacillus sp. LHD-117]|uniref:S41 family peptidase n=1 Tax=Paenibacillus sp. LHD-117 TaxID=3071412 RepID=UPI0027E07B8B|nr:S41 family peptidase [Paenibacillus sp. LHD-117]MDQ6420353.1 S41 family peptidase [Paenibacillus sp. LHD-117]